MKILEKNDIKMSRNNKENEDYGSLIKRKKEYFEENIFSNYSEKEKLLFKEEHWPTELRGNIYLVSNCFTLYFFMFTNNLKLTITQFLLGTIFLLLSYNPSFKKFLLKKWMKEKENYDLLLNRMFLESPVDNEVLKFFIKKYGKEEFSYIIYNKKFLTYEDIKEYMDNASKRNEKKEKIYTIADSLLK